jgi:hypothetical protein
MLNKHTVTKQFLEQLPGKVQPLPTFDRALKQWWFNIRENGGMRLTEHGYIVFNVLELERWEHNLDSKIINADLLLTLDQKLTCPYYITPGKKPRLVMFGSQETMMLKLYGDIDQYLSMLSRQ